MFLFFLHAHGRTDEMEVSDASTGRNMSIERESRQGWSTQYSRYPEIFTRVTNAMAGLPYRCAELLHYLLQDWWHSHETSKIDINLKNRVSKEDYSYKAKKHK